MLTRPQALELIEKALIVARDHADEAGVARGGGALARHLLPIFEESGGVGTRAPAAQDEESDSLPPPEARSGQFAIARTVLDGTGAQLFGHASAWRGNIGAWGEAPAFALGNSVGVRRFAAPSQHALSLTVGLGDATGWSHAEAPAAEPIDAQALAGRALEKAQLDLVGFLRWHATGRSVEEKQSCLTGKLGDRVFGENVTIHDDVRHPLQRGVAFDAEGVPRRTVTLVENGVAKELVWDRATAARVGAEPTGHGLPVPSAEGALSEHLVMEGGDASVDDLIASTERGVLITRSWYTNFVDFRKATITGMTRDGTFLIEGGRITQGLRDLRFNISLFELLNGIEALGVQARCEGVVAPARRVRGFRFTS